MTFTFDQDSYSKLLAEFQPKIITTEDEYEHALEVVQQLMVNRSELRNKSLS